MLGGEPNADIPQAVLDRGLWGRRRIDNPFGGGGTDRHDGFTIGAGTDRIGCQLVEAGLIDRVLVAAPIAGAPFRNLPGRLSANALAGSAAENSAVSRSGRSSFGSVR